MVSVTYFDTSALLKRYVVEIGSDWVNALFALSDAPVVLTSHLTVVEATCALGRRLREGVLSPASHAKILAAFDYDVVYRYRIVDVMSMTIDTACQLANRHPLRAYDAVQLATAWLANQRLLDAGKSPLTFVCADDRLISIAQTEGLLVENPNHHS
jgi:predicted nucleic acid-binding protein